MGTLHYGAFIDAVPIGDHVLAHLKVVIATKLRRHESFTLSWGHPDSDPVGRTTIWLHPAIPLMFTFDERDPIELNVKCIENLMQSANSVGGITLADDALDAPDRPAP
ncbi:MAG TPA: hypothetical protein VN035_09525 [Microbacterium sp.]|nr:hypothetical protein [Microbacterium sp.]